MNKAEQLQADIDDATERAQHGGFTKSLVGKSVPTSGYIVSKKGAEKTLDHPPTAEDFTHYIAEHAAKLKDKTSYLGYWPTDDGRHVLDVSKHIPDEDDAHAFGRKNSQEALYDLNKNVVTPIRKYSDEDEAAIKHLHDNIVHSYNKTTDLDKHAGALWYSEESQKIRDWADRHNVPHDSAIQAFAVISPGQDWDSIHAVMSALHKHGPGVTSGQAGYGIPMGYGRVNFEKAHRILKGESLEDVTTDRAPKVRAFASNLANPDTDADNVTVDGHAHNIGINDFKRIGISSAPPLDVRKYRLVEEAYKRATKTVGAALPHHVQAATWIGYRRMDPKNAAMRADADESQKKQSPDDLSGLSEAWEPGRE